MANPIKVTIPPRPGKPVAVDQALDSQGLPGFVLKSSRAQPLPQTLPAWVPDSTAWLVKDRVGGNNGSSKGRVLAIWKGKTLAAVCSWHLEQSGPPVIFDLACHPTLSVAVRTRLEDVLFLALRSVAARLGRDVLELRFSDHPLDRAPPSKAASWRGEVRARFEALGVEPLRPSPKFWKGRYGRKKTWPTAP